MFGDRNEACAIALGLEHEDLGLAENTRPQPLALMSEGLHGGRLQGRFREVKKKADDPVIVQGHGPARLRGRPAQFAIEIRIVGRRVLSSGDHLEQADTESLTGLTLPVSRYLRPTGRHEGTGEYHWIGLAHLSDRLPPGGHGIPYPGHLTRAESSHYS